VPAADETVTDIVNVSSGDAVHRTASLVANGEVHEDGTNGSSPINYDCTIQQLKVPGNIQPSIVIEPDTHTGTLTGYGASVGLPDLVDTELRVSGGNSCVYGRGSSALTSDNYTDGTVGRVFPGNGDATTLHQRTPSTTTSST
jgi:hypothetical protein